MSFFTELKRRHVFRVVGGYLLLAWLIMQVTDVLSSLLQFPDWVGWLVIYILLFGFPLNTLVADIELHQSFSVNELKTAVHLDRSQRSSFGPNTRFALHGLSRKTQLKLFAKLRERYLVDKIPAGVRQQIMSIHLEQLARVGIGRDNAAFVLHNQEGIGAVIKKLPIAFALA